MRRLFRAVLKLAVIGGVAVAVVKVLQNRSHPDGVVDRNAYNPTPWPPLDDKPGPVKQPAAPAEKAPDAQPTPPKKTAAKKSAPKKAPAKKASAKKAAPVEKSAAKKNTAAKKAPKKA